MFAIKQKYKIVVFDLDETLGYFTELGIFCDALEYVMGNKLNNNEFFEIVDLFNEFLRPHIISILKYIMKMKQRKCCDKIMIYTNNQGPRDWVEKISAYFDNKLEYKLFDQIIGAFKIKGKQIEMNRTSHDKSLKDFVKCTHIPEDAEICFIDDQYHPNMINSNIYYINVKPYIYNIEYYDMSDRYYNKYIPIDDKEDFINNMVDFMNNYNYNVVVTPENEVNVDKIVGKKLLQHLELYFNTSKNNTRKNRKKHRTTKKNTRM